MLSARYNPCCVSNVLGPVSIHGAAFRACLERDPLERDRARDRLYPRRTRYQHVHSEPSRRGVNRPTTRRSSPLSTQHVTILFSAFAHHPARLFSARFQMVLEPFPQHRSLVERFVAIHARAALFRVSIHSPILDHIRQRLLYIGIFRIQEYVYVLRFTL